MITDKTNHLFNHNSITQITTISSTLSNEYFVFIIFGTPLFKKLQTSQVLDTSPVTGEELRLSQKHCL